MPKQSLLAQVPRAAIIVASLIAALAIYFGFVSSPLVQPIAEWTAHWASLALNTLGASTEVTGTVVASDGFAANIVAECTAVGPILVFAAAVMAYPSRLRAKGLGLTLGLATLAGINVLRIVSLFWVGSAFPQYLGLAHLLVWQAAMVLLAIVLWLAWAERIGDARSA